MSERKIKLGEFEEIVMLTVGILHGTGYGVSIKKEIERLTGRRVSVGALQTAISRLEKKGYLRSKVGKGSQVRAGRPKRYYEVTAYGKTVLEQTRDLRNHLWTVMSSLNPNSSLQ